MSVLVRADPAVVAELRAGFQAAATAAADVSSSSRWGPVWHGAAAAAAGEARQRLDVAASEVAMLAGAAAGVLAEFDARVEAMAVRERALDRRSVEAQDANARWVAGGVRGVDPADALLTELRRDQRALAAEYDDAAGRVAAALDALRTRIDGRPLYGRDQYEGYRDAVLGNVADTTALAWGVTGDVLLDRERWWSTVSSLPGQVAHTVLDPVGTARDAVGWDAFRDGRWGAGLGAVTGLLVTRRPAVNRLLARRPWEYGRWQVRAPGDKFARNRADPGAPLPIPQSLDDMIRGVDLTRHEHHDLGHTIRRHVDVTVEYLRDRVRLGTLEDDGTRGRAPRLASAFTDLNVAERSITEVIRRNRDDIEAWIARGAQRAKAFELSFQRPVGHYVERAAPDRPPEPGRHVTVVLEMRQGRVLIVSAMVDP